MNKRGFTDIEIVIAVSMFLFAVVFVLYSLNNFDIKTEINNIGLIESKLRQDAEISYVLINLFVSNDSECFIIPIHADSPLDENKIFIASAGQTAFNSSVGLLKINNTARANMNHTYSIYYFPFNATLKKRLLNENCVNLMQNQYNYSLSYKGRVFTYKNITSLGNYETLKERWNVHEDFAISVVDSNVIYNVSGSKPLQAGVKAKQFPIKIIYENGDIKEAAVYIQIW